jgi:hypothetical protein
MTGGMALREVEQVLRYWIGMMRSAHDTFAEVVGKLVHNMPCKQRTDTRRYC